MAFTQKEAAFRDLDAAGLMAAFDAGTGITLLADATFRSQLQQFSKHLSERKVLARAIGKVADSNRARTSTRTLQAAVSGKLKKSLEQRSFNTL